MKYNVVHELGHALGLEHEHQREDEYRELFNDNPKIIEDHLEEYKMSTVENAPNDP